jgi:hypothetical protein
LRNLAEPVEGLMEHDDYTPRIKKTARRLVDLYGADRATELLNRVAEEIKALQEEAAQASRQYCLHDTYRLFTEPKHNDDLKENYVLRQLGNWYACRKCNRIGQIASRGKEKIRWDVNDLEARDRARIWNAYVRRCDDVGDVALYG